MNNLTTRSERNSSIELIRIIATFTVLIVHFNGWFLGGLGNTNYQNDYILFTQLFIDAASCVCVNLFIIISGYFGLKFKLSSIIHILLILFFIFIPLYIIGSLFEGTFSLRELFSLFFLISRGGYFVQCYFMLIIISPLLNGFINRNSRYQILLWSIIFWIIEIWFGCLKNIETFGYMKGYSIIHFVMIYMLARCVKLYESEIKHVSKYYWIIGYFICTLTIWFMNYKGIEWGYANPLNVISSFCLFMPFMYFSFESKAINWVAKSTFSVYIIQIAYPVLGILCCIDKYLFSTYSYPNYLISILGVIIIIFSFCILYDKAINVIIQQVERKIEGYLGTYYKKILF